MIEARLPLSFQCGVTSASSSGLTSSAWYQTSTRRVTRTTPRQRGHRSRTLRCSSKTSASIPSPYPQRAQGISISATTRPNAGPCIRAPLSRQSGRDTRTPASLSHLLADPEQRVRDASDDPPRLGVSARLQCDERSIKTTRFVFYHLRGRGRGVIAASTRRCCRTLHDADTRFPFSDICHLRKTILS